MVSLCLAVQTKWPHYDKKLAEDYNNDCIGESVILLLIFGM